MRPTILVIEDDPDLGRLFESMLQIEGYNVMLARTITEAQHQLSRREPELIVFDWQLTNAPGYIWIDQMRNNDHTAHIPLLLVCGAMPPRSVFEMLGNIGVPVVEKPFDLMVFSRHVAALLRPYGRAVGAS